MAIFSNQATLSYNDTTVNSNIITGEVLEVLSAVKTAVLDEYSQCQNVTYVVSLVNSGPAAFTGLTLTDDLGAYNVGTATVTPLDYVQGSLRYYVNGTLQATPAITAGPPMTISGVTVPAGGNAILIYEADVNRFAPLGAEDTITNTVTVTGSGLTAPVTAEETINAQTGPVLGITKSLSPTTVADNGQITYTFVIQNTGNAPALATDNVVLTDVFDPILSGLTVTLDGTLLSPVTDYTYDEATGTFATVPGVITVPAAAYTQDLTTGEWSVTPGTAVLTVTGTV